MQWYEDKEYWAMSEGAEEIQNKAKKVLKIPPKTITHLRDGNVCVDGDGRFWQGDLICGGAFQIFSQEDLQEMVIRFRSPASFWQIHFAFNYWLCETFSIGHPAVFGLDTAKVKRAGFTSLNQLWLAFVMHELYQKKWNRETKKWEKRETQ